MRTLTLGAVALLLVALAPPVRAACPCTTDLTMNGLAGDTFVFKLNPDGPGMNLFSPTFFRITGFYDEPKDEAAVMLAFGAFPIAAGNVAFMRVDYGTFVDAELHIEALTDTQFGVQYDFEDHDGAFGGATIQYNVVDMIHFDDADWYFVLSVPEAFRINVRVHLDHNKASLPILATAVSRAGLVAPIEDFAGFAQASIPGHTSALSMRVDAVAPPEHRAFTMLMPINDEAGAAWYEIDGPGASDDTAVSALFGPPDPALVRSGGAGTYEHTVVAESVTTFPGTAGDEVSGHAVVFAAARIPL